MKGRKPKPTALKVHQGNPGKRPLNRAEPKPPSGAPLRPDDLLDAEAVAEWDRMLPVLETMGVLSRADSEAMTGLCSCWSRYVTLQKLCAGAPPIFKTTKGNIIPHPLWGMLRTEEDNLKKWLVEFGLTPSSRSRMIGGNNTEESDPLVRMMKEREKRHA